MALRDLFTQRTDLLRSIHELTRNALLDPDVQHPKCISLIADAADDMMNGWRKLVIATSSSTPGYEFDDLSTETTKMIKEIEHAQKMLRLLWDAK
jgi:hypothetical protein